MRVEGWTDFYDWKLDRASATPIFRQIYSQVRTAILSRTFAPGAKLPSTRQLASRLGVARASAVAAYEQLLAEGYLCGKIGSGTYISSDIPEPIDKRAPNSRRLPRTAGRLPPRAQIFNDFESAIEQSDERPFALGRTLLDARTVEVWRRLSHRAVRTFDPVHLGYSDPRGFIELRRSICDYLQAARAVRCDPEQVVVTAGAQHAIDIAIRILLGPGEEVWVEDPGYPFTHDALVAAGMNIRPIPVDDLGIDVRAGIASAPKARAAFVTPSHQYPTGAVLSMARRLELLAWARKADAWIIEDDHASEFRYSGRPLASLQGLDDDERVIYVGTFNKALFPGLRIGYAAIPPTLLPAFVRARYLMDRQPPSLYQTVVAEFMREGHLAGHIRRIRLLYRDQRDLLTSELARRTGARVKITVPDQGMHVVADLDEGLSDTEIEYSARQNGVVVRAMSRLYKVAPPRSALMLGFAGYPRPMIPPAVARLAQVIERQPGARRSLAATRKARRKV